MSRNPGFKCIIAKVKILVSTSQKEKRRRQMKLLANYLNVSDAPEDELASLEDIRMEGSCLCLTGKLEFQEWEEANFSSSKIFWLHGKPAAGKSVLASYIINVLSDSNRECSYYFFKHGDSEASSLSGLLRSMAYQMASVNANVRNALHEMQQDEELKFDTIDERAIWRKLFMARVFRTDFHQPHFWIIDGLDECKSCGAFPNMLAKIEEKIPLRVLITSRRTPELEKLLIPLGVTSMAISMDDTLNDIRLYLEANIDSLPTVGKDASQQLIDDIVVKSKGCFLWACLVLEQLEDTYNEQQIKEVLEEVPQDMDLLYERILHNMSTLRGRDLAKAILTWVTCAARPLSTEELEEALKFDLNESVAHLERSIATFCGQLVYIDKYDKVQLVHDTLRQYLLRERLQSDFVVDRSEAHRRLAEACLRYLLSGEMRMPRRHRKTNLLLPLPKRSVFADYAGIYFAEHLGRSSSSFDEPLILLYRFLESNVLPWIELIAHTQDLYHLMRTAENLKAYLERRAKYRAPIGIEIQIVEAWITDIIRVVATFGRNLLSSPACIYSLIPPLCPPDSILRQRFRSSSRSLEVVGLSAQTWSDRICCVYYGQDRSNAIACRDNRYAVGLWSGVIVLYLALTFQEDGRLDHGEPVKLLEFAPANSFLVSGGRKKNSFMEY